ncbi:MAG: efflux RND transporter periplasmic adaptor subunit [Holosporaceae bacterium]|nr:efflux RND transporter periplasmic adaptor subunit [Holosporaceae bacterium]
MNLFKLTAYRHGENFWGKRCGEENALKNYSQDGFEGRFRAHLGKSLLIFFVLLGGCDEKKPATAPPAQLVGASRVMRQDIPFVLEVPAKITGSLEIQVRAQVGGILKSRLFNEGQYVNQGDKLFEINPESYEAALSRAQGSLAQAESELRRTSRDYERMRKLRQAKAISPKEHDDAQSAFERAQANLKVAEGSVKEAEINLGYTEVKAPISGIVGKEAQSVGNLISPMGESSLLTTMVQICPLHAVFSVSGTVWSQMARNSMAGKVQLLEDSDYKIEVIMSDGTRYPQDGKIIFVDSTEDNLTSSVSIKAEIPNDNRQKLLMPGQFVRVKVIGAEYKNATVVPSSALISTQMGYVAYVVKDDKTVEVRPVKAEIVGNQAIVDTGLEENEIVVSEGIVKVRPGNKVNVVMKETEPE